MGKGERCIFNHSMQKEIELMQRGAQGSCPTTGAAKEPALALEVKGQREW